MEQQKNNEIKEMAKYMLDKMTLAEFTETLALLDDDVKDDLICAMWEVYHEDCAKSGVQHAE